MGEAGTCKPSSGGLVQLGEQWVPVVVKSTGPLPVCTGTNGLDGTNCARAICNGTNGPMDGASGTPCTKEEPAAIPHYNTEPTAGQPYQTSGNITPTHPSALDPPAPISAALKAGFDNKGYPQPEKVLVLDPKIARTHTTFYAQVEGDDAKKVAAEPMGVNQQMSAEVKANYS